MGIEFDRIKGVFDRGGMPRCQCRGRLYPVAAESADSRHERCSAMTLISNPLRRVPKTWNGSPDRSRSPVPARSAAHVRRSLAKRPNRRVGFEQQPRLMRIPREKRQSTLDFWTKDFDAPLPRAPLGFNSSFVVQHFFALPNSPATIDTFTLACVKVTNLFFRRRKAQSSIFAGTHRRKSMISLKIAISDPVTVLLYFTPDRATFRRF
jgi:hypothetical protein